MFTNPKSIAVVFTDVSIGRWEKISCFELYREKVRDMRS